MIDDRYDSDILYCNYIYIMIDRLIDDMIDEIEMIDGRYMSSHELEFQGEGFLIRNWFRF